MKQIEVNPSNKPYYSEDFIKGFECGTKTQFEADKAVIDRIKEAREEIDALCGSKGLDDYDYCSGLIYAMHVLDKLIAEVEGNK